VIKGSSANVLNQRTAYSGDFHHDDLHKSTWWEDRSFNGQSFLFA